VPPTTLALVPTMTVSLRTQLCRDLGIAHPIMSVGFGSSAGPELTSAVSEAGGLGVLGGVASDEIRRRVAAVRAATSRPFGVNLIIAELDAPDAAENDIAFVRSQ